MRLARHKGGSVSRRCVRVVRPRGRVASSPGERKLNMPDSISQSTATVLRINGREMSYCAIFVRDLCARPSLPVPPAPCTRLCALSSARNASVSFIPSLVHSLARGGGYRRDASGERSRGRVLPTLRPRFHSLRFFFLSFPPHNGDCIGIAFFRPMLIDFFRALGLINAGHTARSILLTTGGVSFGRKS